MHRIFWGAKQVGMLTNQIDAAKHKHWMLQLFYSPQKQLELKVEDQYVSGNCVLVGSNVIHEFTTGDQLHVSFLIEGTSDIALQLKEKYLKVRSYVDLSQWTDETLKTCFVPLQETKDVTSYQAFCHRLWDNLKVRESDSTGYDNRIHEVLDYLEGKIYSIGELANLVALSPSRLAHLFKQETGIPLKSYLVLHMMYDAFYQLLQGVNVTEAAMNAGFDSPSHFASTTKAMMGTSAKIAVKDSDFLKVSPWDI